MSQYTYEALPQRYEHIRQIELIRRNTTTSQPECLLHPIPFSQALWYGREYSALSYMWGECTPTRSILINGHRHEVRQNLFDFFEAYLTHSWGSSKTEPRRGDKRFWIDQICINQADVEERNSQVRLMSKIYKTARRVLVWLGNHPDIVSAAREIRMPQADHSQAICTLLSHQYFSRLWIIQEIALATEVEIICGDVALSWESFKQHVWPGNPDIWPQIPIQAVDVVSASQELHTLQSCIILYRDGQCQDPRDKVYGLLGMTSERWRLQIDYSKTVLEVFLDAVMALYEELFDMLDPVCHYTRVENEDDHIKRRCVLTLRALAKSMGLPGSQIEGILPFLEHLQEVFLKSPLRNIHFTYAGKLFQIDSENEITVRWDSVTATRRNPLVLDVIEGMGLQLGCSCIGFGPPIRDCWYFSYGSSEYHFPCPPISDRHEPGHYQYVRITDGRSMVFNVDAPRLTSTPSGPPFPPIAPRGSDFLFNGSDSYFVFPKPHQAKRL